MGGITKNYLTTRPLDQNSPQYKKTYDYPPQPSQVTGDFPYFFT